MFLLNRLGLNLWWMKKLRLNGFIEIVNKSKCKPNKLWVNKERKFYNYLIQKWLDNHDVLMYLRCHERKSVVAKWFIRPAMGKKKIKKDS